MKRAGASAITEAKEAALEVLLHNARGPFGGLPRTAGWGYPEPYTRDLLISSLGIMACGNALLLRSLRRVFTTLAQNQSPLGQIPSLVHDPEDRGSSDTTPLFLLTLGLFRRYTGHTRFLEGASRKALRWMAYQSPEDRAMVAQQPTSDWRDEQWVLGYGLYVNALVHGYFRLLGDEGRARVLRATLNRPGPGGGVRRGHPVEGLAIHGKPHYALWSYKVLRDERCDVLGNSLAILTGVASRARAGRILDWIETECGALRARGELALDLPPCLMPVVLPKDTDWHPRYASYNLPGHYHNGGVWPFVCGFYVAALVAAGQKRRANEKLAALTELVKPSREAPVRFGFNEWFRPRDGAPAGQDWQTWSASMYLYAAACVEAGRALYF